MGYGYVPVQILIAFAAGVLAVFLGIVGSIWLIAIRKRLDCSLGRALVLWWLGIVGAIYFSVGVTLLFFDLWVDFSSAPMFVVALLFLGLFLFLPAVLVELWLPKFGARCLMFAAAVAGCGLLFVQPSEVFPPYQYSSWLKVLAFGILLPQWIAVLAIMSTACRWRNIRYDLRQLLWGITVLCVALGTCGGVIRNATRLDRVLRVEMNQRLAIEAAVHQAVQDFETAAVAGNDLGMEAARKQILKNEGMLSESDVLDRIERQAIDAGKIELLNMLSSEALWKSGQYAVEKSVSRIESIITDQNQSIEVRQAAIRVLMNWGNWKQLAILLPTTTNQDVLSQTVAEFICSQSQQAERDIGFRLTPNDGAVLVRKLPTLMTKPVDSVEALVALAGNRNGWRDAVTAAAETLGTLGATAGPALPEMKEIYSKSNYSNVKRALRQSIDQIENPTGPTNKSSN